MKPKSKQSVQNILPVSLLKFYWLQSNRRSLLRISMIILFIPWTLLAVARPQFVNAIESQYPFKIGRFGRDSDFILLEYYNVYLGGQSYDSETYNISYVQEHSRVPNSVLLTVLCDQILTYSDTLAEYSILATDVTKTGFKLTTKVNPLYRSVFLIGYMTITNGYGITINYYDLSQLTVNNTGVINGFKMNTTIYIAAGQSIKSSIFITRIRIVDFNQDQFVTTSTTVTGNYLMVSFQYPKLSTIQYLTLVVYLHREQQLLTQMSANGFQEYIYQSAYNTFTSNSGVVFALNTNDTSSIFYTGGATKLKIKKVLKIGVRISFDNPTADTFNTTYLSNRKNDGDNSVYAWNNGVNSSTPSQFTSIRFYRKQCESSSFPYLLMTQQRCYTQCPKYYYNNTLKRCNQCVKCVNIADCMYCHYSMCQSDQYYIHVPNNTCVKCTALDPKCGGCYDGKCLFCLYPYQMNNSSCFLPRFSFNSSVNRTRQYENFYVVDVMFEGNVTLVLENYNCSFEVDGETVPGVFTRVYSINDSIQASITVPNTVWDMKTIEIRFVQIGGDDVLTKLQQDLDISREPEPAPQQAVFGAMGQTIQAMSQNSGSILSALSVTSLSGYVVGILWNFQIASYYLFLKVQKPSNLVKFLNMTIQMQNVQILPFQIPSPFPDDVQIKGDPSYQLYSIDLYFLRTNIDGLICLALFSIFYTLLYFMFLKFKPKNMVTKFIRTKFVNRVYMNISMNFYSLVTVIAFTASAALSSHNLDDKTEIMNSVCASIGLFVTFVFSMVHPIVLFRYKQSDCWDTQECYIGLKREKHNSELVLSMFLISQMIIPVAIPLLDPVASMSIIILSSICNLVLIVKMPIVKFGICIYYRIASHLSFIAFNSLFVVCLILERYFPQIDICKLNSLGYASIALMAIVISLEFVELITEIIMDFIRLVKRVMLKNKIQQLQSPSQVTPNRKVIRSSRSKRAQKRRKSENKQNSVSNSTNNNLKLKKQVSLKTELYLNKSTSQALYDSDYSLKFRMNQFKVDLATPNKQMQTEDELNFPPSLIQSKIKRSRNQTVFSSKYKH